MLLLSSELLLNMLFLGAGAGAVGGFFLLLLSSELLLNMLFFLAAAGAGVGGFFLLLLSSELELNILFFAAAGAGFFLTKLLLSSELSSLSLSRIPIVVDEAAEGG